MPNDKNAANAPLRKPLTPSVSSAFRTGRTPIVPKLAESARPSPFTSPRDSNRTVPNTSPAVHTPIAHVDTTSSHLDSNITPRSGTRKSKFGGSPGGVGNAHADIAPRSRPVSVVGSQSSSYDRSKSAVAKGLAISSSNSMTSVPSRPMSMIVGDSTNPSVRQLSVGKDAAAAASPFFHADDAQSSISLQSTDETPSLLTKSATFFYADQASDHSRPTNSTPIQFPRREGPKETRREPMRIAQPRSLPAPSTVRNIPRRSPSPRVAATGSQQKILNRPASPLKAMSLESMPAKTGMSTPQKDSINTPPHQTNKTTSSSTSSTSQARRTSVGSVGPNHERSGHRRTPSIGTPPSPRRYRKSSLSINSSPQAIQASVSDPQPPFVSSPEASPHSTSFGSSNGVHSLVSETLRSPEVAPISPTKPAQQLQQSQVQKMNDLAANARRERKVLDLEISNSSLLAINRTLEKELRKQAGDLRRFRRLSRAGRLSAVAPSVRSLSGQSARTISDDVDDTRSEASHLSEIDESEDDDDLESSLDDGDGSSLASHETRDARHRARDEKRLLLDLSKHHQMLVDSQKVSQSIRRCVTWTEELIAEGQKALAHNVRVSDIEIGGRVLTHEDDAEVSNRRALLSPGAQVGELDPWETVKTLESTESIPELLQGLDGLARDER